MRQKRNLGAVEPDSLRTVQLSERDIAQQANIRVKRHPVAVDGFGW